MNEMTKYFFTHDFPIFTQSDVTAVMEGTFYSRHALLKRAIQKQEILVLRRGLYCLSPAYRKFPIETLSIAQKLCGPSYVSVESALSYHGLIPEGVQAVTSVSLSNRKDFDTPLGFFSFRRIPQQHLFQGVERIDHGDTNIYFMATPVKALFDYQYLHKENWTGIEDPVESLRIDTEMLLSFSPEEIQKAAVCYTQGRIKKFADAWIKEVQV